MRGERPETLLIFRLGSIGDTVVALPCFHAIARRHPHHRRVLLTNALTSVRASSAESVLDGTGLIDECIYYPVGAFSLRLALKLRRDIRRLRPRIMIYLAERPAALPVYRDLAFFRSAGIARIIGVPWRRQARLCAVDPATAELEYEAERLARLLRNEMPVGLAAEDWDLRLSKSELAAADAALGEFAAAPTLIAMAAGAKIPAKDWGAANWGDLVGALASDHPRAALVLVGARDEREHCAGIAERWHGPVLNLCGALTPRETAAVLRRCALLLCHDSGPMHLAAAQGTRCLALFGNYNLPRKWYPYGNGHVVIHEPRGMRAIEVGRVLQAARDALRVPVAHRPGTG